MPAAIEIMRCCLALIKSESSLRTELTIWGFTAITIVLQFLPISKLSLVVSIPNSVSRAKRCESSGELAMIFFGSSPPLINPAIRALAMFPAPINPMSFLREFIVLAQISWSPS